MVTITIQIASPTRITGRAPYRSAARPNTSAPTMPTNCTSRIRRDHGTDCPKPSSSTPYVEEEAITVWMPSLKNR